MSNNLWQSWDNIIDYIKLEMGAYVLDLELSDDEIVNILKEHTLPFFSRYSPLIRYYYMTDEENMIQDNPTRIYQIKNFKYKVIKILEVIGKPDIMDYNTTISTQVYSGDVTDILAQNYITQASSTVLAPDTYQFFPPDKVELIKSNNSFWLSNDFILKLACAHDDPSTISGDLYNYFRDLATADIMNAVGRIRSKYQSFGSPVGQIDLTSQDLIQEARQLKQETIDKLDRLPPEQYIWVF